MTSFHELLERYITERNTAVARMAEYCGMERSSLYRILRGQRTPSSEETVRCMATYLCLSPGEEDALLEAYRVELIGYDNYVRRQYIDSFLRNFHTVKSVNDLYIPAISPKENRTILAQTLDNHSDIIRLFSKAVMSECSRREDAHIRLFLPPDPEFINILISVANDCSHPVRVDHLIQLHQSENAAVISRDNFSMILDTLPMVTANADYNPFYLYSEVIPRLPLFYPYLCFTADTVFWISEDLNSGLAVHHPTIFPYMAAQFDRTLAQCRILYEVQDISTADPQAQLEVIASDSPSSLTHLIAFPPLSMDQPGADTHLAPDYPQRESVLRMFPADLDSFQKVYMSLFRRVIFSRSGLEQFAQTGLIPRYTKGLYAPLSPAERKEILRRICRMAETVDLRFVRRDIYNFTDGISVIVGDTHCCLEIYSSTATSRYLIISEPNFLDAFQDFCSSLTEKELFSREESLQILQKIIDSLEEDDIPS